MTAIAPPPQLHTQTVPRAPKALGNLPDIFSLDELCADTAMPRKSALVAVSRWAVAGHIRLAGPKSAVYLKTSLPVDASSVLLAIRQVYPSAIICANSILAPAGWMEPSAQQQIHIAIEKRPSVVTLFGVSIHQRSPRWFEVVKYRYRGFHAIDSGVFGVPKLRPEWALADLMLHEKGSALSALQVPQDFVTQQLIKIATRKLSQT